MRGLYIVMDERQDVAHTAFAKAPGDVSSIALSMGFEPWYIYDQNLSNLKFRRIKYYWSCLTNGFKLPQHAKIVIQHPMDRLFRGWYGLAWGLAFFRFLLWRTDSKVIAVVHDLEDIRSWLVNKQAAQSTDTERLRKVSDVVVAHNEAMCKWLQGHGFKAEEIVTLGIFDYLADGFEPEPEVEFVRRVNYAGNLRLDKSPFLRELKKVKRVDWHLYGNKYSEDECGAANVKYHGSFPPEKLLSELRCGFGLVWDGESLDGCVGNTGQYLTVNNPHKLSMYLAAGLPVIIWDKAARADFVRQNDLGVVISSLRNLDEVLAKVSANRYAEMRRNVLDMSVRVRSGYFTRVALEKSIQKLEAIVN